MLTISVSVLSLFFACLNAQDVEFTNLVRTDSGPVVGMYKDYNGSRVSQFLGIPFAKPPVGDLRFRKPVSIQPWKETLQATEFTASCMQYLFDNDRWLIPNWNISEDCLHLNVFVPNVTETDAPRAVMVWIHGGGFTAGQSSLYDGSYLALTGDVIVVTINYRLGLFGFLSTEDDSARGNYGLWDQVLAIKWVHDNIGYFGGDSSNICIFGESAGGFSASLQTLLPVNKGHFSRSISESGTACSPSAVAVDTLTVAQRAAAGVNCPVDNGTEALVECLRSVPAEDILKIEDHAYNGFDEPPNFHSRIGAVVDGELLTDTPENLLSNKQSDAYRFFNSLDILIGSNNAEGALMYWSLMQYQNKYGFDINEGVPNDVLCNEVAQRATRSFYNDSQEVNKALCQQYSLPSGTLAESGRSILNLYADLQFMIPTIRILDFHAEEDTGGNTYQYVFTHQPSYSWIRDRPAWLEGANHCDEEPFVFGLNAMYPDDHVKPAEELFLSEQVMKYWSNFAKTG